MMVRSSLGTVYDDPDLWIGTVYGDSPGYDVADYIPAENVPAYSVTVTDRATEVPLVYADTSSYVLPGAQQQTPHSVWSTAVGGQMTDVAKQGQSRSQSGFGIPLPLVAAIALGLFLGLRN
jgi:hypothetical protein